MTVVYLGLGSNLGDREAVLRAAIRALDAGGVRILHRSSVYETEPVGLRDQPRFLNLVVEAETALSPDDLLALIQLIEASLGRTREVRWGPRTVDIDILLFGDETVVTDRLTIPHPEIRGRRFVLEPLAELRPDLKLPGGPTVADALAALGSNQPAYRVGVLT
jgi:2-amino-4-hydroxy-6-hydroxymethyldihydropteridine diphosphokinase